MTDFSDRRTLALSEDGDLKLNELNRFEWVTGKDAVVQEIKVTLATIKGEDPFDEDHGVDVFSISNTGEGLLASTVREAIMQMHEDDVQRIVDVEVEEPNEYRQSQVNIDLVLADGSEERITL